MKTLEKKIANPSKNSARKEKETKRKTIATSFTLHTNAMRSNPLDIGRELKVHKTSNHRTVFGENLQLLKTFCLLQII